ncbi:DUF748 domain-containing protein [Candidatus Accumulibacter phosphatis]|uniref:DUF748 domain-containing protein n=2 Tax=Candidatus Accumulibacter TaxID=327159 RepID=A0ABX1U323_9PROT|nr:DUF748 domain-containing protein [Candidatus Accumulibacter phosphatis]NMQ29425.1 DUF748 domain-containing protein [Candidatus Accumulibacter phosphatis]
MLVFSVLGFLGLPLLAKWVLVDQLSKTLQRPVAVESVRINPYTLLVQVAGFAIQEKGGGETVAAFDSLQVDAEWSSLWRGGPVISELSLVAPTVRVVRLADGRFNFSDLIDEFAAQPASDAPTPLFSLNNIQISRGKIDFDDQMLAEKHQLGELNIGLPFISSLPQATAIFVEPTFSASINGSPLLVQGKSKPFDASMESDVAFELRDVQLGKYIDYLPHGLPIEVVSGALDSDLKLAFQHQEEGRSTLVISGGVALKDLVVKNAAGAPLLSLRRLDVVVGSLDPLNGKFVIDRVSLEEPEIHARVSTQGSIDWVDFFSAKQASPRRPVSEDEARAKSSPLEWSLGEAEITGGALRWRDESRGEPFDARVDGLAARLRNVDSKSSAASEFDLAFSLDAEPWVKLKAFSVQGGRFDLAKREVLIGEVAVRDAMLLIRRTADGSILFVEPPSLRAVEAAQEDSSKPWELTLAKYRGENLGLRFEDSVMSPVVVHSIEAMKVDAENLSTEPGTTARIATRFRVNTKGDVEVGGTVKFFPLLTELKLAVKTLELIPLQPYFTEQLNVVLSSGQVSLSGDVRMRQAPAAGAAEAGKLAGSFTGEVVVANFAAVDKLDSSDFLKWKSLSFANIDARLNPNSLSIAEVGLAQFFARVVIDPQGKLNLSQIVRESGAAAAGAADKAKQATAVIAAEGKAVAPVATAEPPQLPIKVGKINLRGGDIKFSDHFIKPNYSADLKKIGGTISGLSSADGSLATLDLRGSYDNIAPLTIAGQLNPLIADPFLDLKADVKGIELTALSPYSSKYAGYAIDKGKLSLFVKYKIEKKQLTAENRIFLDQLTFGEAVDSPEATRLPVSLAVALLKNSKGEIDINLPVAGSLDDPEFSIGGVLGELIGNLLVKVVTSPFALLGSVFGGGEELSNVEFDPGRASLAGSAKPRLEALAKALLERPALKLEITGQADSENDPEGLKRARLDSKLRALKSEAGKKGDADVAVGTIDMDSEEYPELLERVYRDEDFEKPRNMLGIAKSLPVAEMETLILANTVLDEQDLRDLADRRAKAVRDWLLVEKVPAERLFLHPAEIVKTDDKSESSAQGKGNRVVFSLL